MTILSGLTRNSFPLPSGFAAVPFSIAIADQGRLALEDFLGGSSFNLTADRWIADHFRYCLLFIEKKTCVAKNDLLPYFSGEAIRRGSFSFKEILNATEILARKMHDLLARDGREAMLDRADELLSTPSGRKLIDIKQVLQRRLNTAQSSYDNFISDKDLGHPYYIYQLEGYQCALTELLSRLEEIEKCEASDQDKIAELKKYTAPFSGKWNSSIDFNQSSAAISVIGSLEKMQDWLRDHSRSL